MKRVLIVYLHGIGDQLIATPAIHAFKKKHPHSEITLMTVKNPQYKELWKHNKDINNVIFSSLDYNPRYGHPSFWLKDYWKIRRDIRRAKKIHKFTKVYFIVHYRLPAALYSKLTFTRRYFMHKCYIIAKKLDVRPYAHEYVFRLTSQEKKSAETYLKKNNIKKNLVGVHFTGSSANKSIPFDLGEKILHKLVSKGHQILVFNDPHSYQRERKHHEGKNVFSIVSNNILHTAALVDKCRYLICVDSAIAHLSGALDKPVFTTYFRKVWSLNSTVLNNKATINVFNNRFINEVCRFIDVKK